MKTAFDIGQDVILSGPLGDFEEGTTVTIVGFQEYDGNVYYCFKTPDGRVSGGWLAERFSTIPNCQ